MSSHREAPEISKDPVADNTDVYAFVSPDRPGYGHPDRQLHPAAVARRRTELLRVRRRRAVRDPHLQLRRPPGPTSATSSGSPPRSSTRTPFCTTPARSARSPTPRTGTGRSTTRSPGWRTASDDGWDGGPQRPRPGAGKRAHGAAGQRRRAQHAELRGHVHQCRRPQPRRRPPGLRRPARGCLPRRPGQHLRPGRAAPVRGSSPDPVRGRGRASTACRGSTCTASRCRCRSAISPGAARPRTTCSIRVRSSGSGPRPAGAGPRCSTPTTGHSVSYGPYQQVSRLGNPLFNEVIVPMAEKDLWNALDPH